MTCPSLAQSLCTFRQTLFTKWLGFYNIFDFVAQQVLHILAGFSRQNCTNMCLCMIMSYHQPIVYWSPSQGFQAMPKPAPPGLQHSFDLVPFLFCPLFCLCIYSLTSSSLRHPGSTIVSTPVKAIYNTVSTYNKYYAISLLSNCWLNMWALMIDDKKWTNESSLYLSSTLPLEWQHICHVVKHNMVIGFWVEASYLHSSNSLSPNIPTKQESFSFANDLLNISTMSSSVGMYHFNISIFQCFMYEVIK